MWKALAIGVGIMAAGGTLPQQQASGRFLVLGEAAVDIADGSLQQIAPIRRRWDPKLKHNVETIGSVEFVLGKAFWQMIDKNNVQYSAKKNLEITAGHELLYRGKKVEIDSGVKYVDAALHWGDWVVGVAGLVNPKGPEAALRGKGGPWYVFWFNEKSLQGSYRFLSSVVAGPLRIYSQ